MCETLTLPVSALPLSTPPENPPTVSARELHEMLLLAHAAGNTARKRFIDLLRTVAETGLYLQLGFPSIIAYAEAAFRYHKTQTHRQIQVSRALSSLPRITAAFECGALSWSLTADLARVATAETEGEWLRYLEGRRVAEVRAEILHAVKRERDRPRPGGFGLPGLPVKVSFELLPEEHALLEKGLQKVQGEMAESLGGEQPGAKDVLLYLLRRVLETEPGETAIAGRQETGLSPFTIVVHKCDACAHGAVETGEGRVELAPQALERIEREAEKLVVEGKSAHGKEATAPRRQGPFSPSQRRSLCLREGGRCANPLCRREIGRDGQAHHIEFLSEGGLTVLENGLWACSRCHALIHLALLTVERDAAGQLVWRPASASLTSSLREALERSRALPVVRAVEPARLAAVHSASAESRTTGSKGTERRARDVLLKLGFTSAEARRRLEIVTQRQREERPGHAAQTVEELVKEALRL